MGGAACLATGPFFPLCLAVVLPTTTAIGAISGAAVGAVRTESSGAIETKTRALRDDLVATPYNDMLARQLREQLASDVPLGTIGPVAAATALTERDDDRPWTIEVGVTEVGTEGKSGRAGDAATRIENRIGEPAANPYLYIASQIHAGLDGIERGLAAPPATTAPYAESGARIPASLGAALAALATDDRLVAAFGAPVVDWLTQIKRSELARYEAADDKDDWQAREYFGRI